MFHVKHTPVEESPAAGRSFLDQAMYAGVDDLDREDLGDLGDAGNPLAGEIGASPLLAIFDARDQLATWRLDASDDAEKVSLRRKQLLALIRPERATVREKVDRLQQARFTRAVLSHDSCCLRIELQVSSADATEILDIDRGQHMARGLDQSRIGITTYFACGVELALTRQLLFASVSPSSTWPTSMAASASSR